MYLQYTRRVAHSDISYHVQTSSDFTNWVEDNAVAHEISAAPDVNGITETVAIRSVKPIDQIPGGKLFMRIGVSKP